MDGNKYNEKNIENITTDEGKNENENENEINNKEETDVCILCLYEFDESDMDNNLLKIPCKCKAYCHQSCFNNLIDKKRCLICKYKYDFDKYTIQNEKDIYIYVDQDELSTSDEGSDSHVSDNIDDENDNTEEGIESILSELDEYNVFTEIIYTCFSFFIVFLAFLGILFLSICLTGFFINIFFCLFKIEYCRPLDYHILVYGMYGMPIVLCIFCSSLKLYTLYRRITD